MAKPICFMVMPFSIKETGLGPSEPGPKKVDFDALWDRALRPAIEACGYTAVRADQDAGALIIVEMIERLAMSELVVADISIGNANVYYEIGVRHAAQQFGSVLISASWSRVLFDIDQMPRVVYPMDEGIITDATAAEIRLAIEQGIEGMRGGESPVFQAVPGFPAATQDDARVSRFQDDMQQVNALLGRIRSVRRTLDVDARKAAALGLRDEIAAQKANRDGVVVELMELLRDCVGWEETKAWIEDMPERLRKRSTIEEQRLLAMSKSGDPQEAIGALEQLVRTAGDTSERQGLLGGRYKKLFSKLEPDDPKRIGYLNRAIEHYERGMLLDLNDYYPSCNLPRLYAARNNEGDDDRARMAGSVSLKACERARALNPDDEWLRPTLLGAAFDAQDILGARRLAGEVIQEGIGVWKLETTIADLRFSALQASDSGVLCELARIFNELNDALPTESRLEPLPAEGKGKKRKKDKKKDKRKKKDKKKKKP